MSHDLMTQEAPWPGELESLVVRLEYRPGWRFALQHEDRGQGSIGLTFNVYTKGYDTYHVDRGENYRVCHSFIVPAANYNRESWARWLLDRLIDVETHEACEWFQIRTREDSEPDRPFAPNHGPGWDPYMVLMLNTPEAVATRFTGERTDLKVPEGFTPTEIGVHIGADGTGSQEVQEPPEWIAAAQVLGARGTVGVQATQDPKVSRLIVSDATPNAIVRVLYYARPELDEALPGLPPIVASKHATDEVRRLDVEMGE